MEIKAEKIICYSNENKDNKVQGIITQESDNTFLLKLESKDFNSIESFRHTKIINGEINGTKVCIHKFLMLRYDSPAFNNKGIYQNEYKIYNFLSGLNCFDLNLLKFDKIICNYNYFDTWVKNFSFYAIPEEKHLEALSKTMFGAQKVDTYNVNDEFNVNISVAGSGLFHFQENCDLYIEKENATYDYLFEKAIKIGKLLSIFCSNTVELKSPIILMTNDKKSVATLEGKQWIKEEKDIYLPFIINYDELKPYFDKILNNYFKSSDKIQLAVDMIHTSYYYSEAPGASINTFLSVTKAIESIYDSEMFNFSEKENEEKQKIKELIRNENVSCKIKDKLNNALHGIHKIAFEERLKQLFEDSRNNLSTKSQESIPYLAKLIADTRNFYTHLEKEDDTVIIEETDLEVISLVLRIYCNIRLLKYLTDGFDNWEFSMKLMARNTLENYCMRTIKEE